LTVEDLSMEIGISIDAAAGMLVDPKNFGVGISPLMRIPEEVER